MRSIRRPSPALIVSCVALFAALGGTSYAAVKITGKEIAKRTITGGNVKNRTLGPKKVRLDSLTGNQINESTLGLVPKASDADTIDGVDSTELMRIKPRLFEAVETGNQNNFPSGGVLATLHDLPAGSYLVTARLAIDNDGATVTQTCTLHAAGVEDETTHAAANVETVVLQKIVTSAGSFSPSVSCTSDGDDDALGTTSIVATRVD
jgi:hypothetical protein